MVAGDNNSAGNTSNENSVDEAVAQGGAYELIRKRLLSYADELEQNTKVLNSRRVEEFGASDMKVAARVRVRTENNCVARDIVQVGDYLLFAYNVFIGLKKDTCIEDVFSLFVLQEKNGDFGLQEQNAADTFLSDSRFTQDFSELYRYYKHARLIETTIKDGKLLMGFQIGERLEDVRVFRWAVSADGKKVEYIDNRGERDIQLPPAYDFEWQQCTRDDVVHGRHAHVNILDKVFVETVNGDLTIKVENNTEDGFGIYRETVEDKTQSIDDAEYYYAQLHDLILIKVLPYREQDWRYFIFNVVRQTVVRIDAIGVSCIQLPEDHGIIFPGGYYLQNGEYKTFDEQPPGLRFKRSIKSPNGEDVLYIFYAPEEGDVGLFAYNLIEKNLQNPIFGHGYALSENGQLVIFSAEEEPTRIHPMQIWETPYVSDEYASNVPASKTVLGRIGNSSLVRGVSDLFSVCRDIAHQSVSISVYEALSRASLKVFDEHYWLNDQSEELPELKDIAQLSRDISATAELAIDEFAKVESIRKQSEEELRKTQLSHKEKVNAISNASWDSAEEYVNALDGLRNHAGRLATIKELRYMDVAAIDVMSNELTDAQERLSQSTVAFLANPEALLPYYDKIDNFNIDLGKSETISELQPIIDRVVATASGLDLLSELLSSLKVDDATIRTQIIDSISEVYAKLNQCKASAGHKKKNVGAAEAIAEFSAQFKLFSQSITNALGSAVDPESCDEQMSRLLVQLEELESRFSDHDEFISDICVKRDEIYESFESRKQQLLDERERRAQSISDSAVRILSSIEKRSQKFNDAEKLNTYFASDALVLKVRDFINQLHTLESRVKADDIEAKFKSLKEQSLRSLRDKSDLYEGGGSIIKLGPRHRFLVNTQELDLTLLPRNNTLNLHLTGTDYFDVIDNPELSELSAFWSVNLASESDEVYRSEYLVDSILRSAEAGLDDLSMPILSEALIDVSVLEKLVRDYVAPRYKEGYEKGIHDHDAVKILQCILPAMSSADLLRFDPCSRAVAQVFWANKKRISEQLENLRLSVDTWQERARSAATMRQVFSSQQAHDQLVDEIVIALNEFILLHPIEIGQAGIRRCADYLVYEMGRERLEFIGSKQARQLVEELKRSLNDTSWRSFQVALEKMKGWPAERWSLSCSWLSALIDSKNIEGMNRYIPEAAALINADDRIDRRNSEVDLELTVTGLMGEHSKIQSQTLAFALDEFFLTLDRHHNEFVPSYRRYQQVRQKTLNDERKILRLEEFKARPLSSFVRNRLINEAYLPIIGDNLAKQMGTAGDTKRTDLMGLLMMISPPGYGKTTLMEYVASRLGLIFMKINCPSLGHDVLSLDPEQAPNATARQELNKINLALEMGSNVMLYLDDIQHTNPEFLQKFISLCDGTRRIEGVFKGESKTYDMRGRKFCVVMAGNPYTESGDVFQIPDMLANRADIYNLGDVLGGMEEPFALSYIENSLTSNAVLAPLATRDINDVYLFIKLAEGRDVATTDLSHQYSGAEVNEIVDIFKKLFVIRDVILKINQQYIHSAAQADNYRTEPPFKLQGSYRNMNKMGEKISSIMNNDELMQLIADHYQGEAQLLTDGAEENLLKLAELRGNMTETQSARWVDIKTNFLRDKAAGGSDTDTGTKIVSQLIDLVSGVRDISDHAKNDHSSDVYAKSMSVNLAKISKSLHSLSLSDKRELPKIELPSISAPKVEVEVINQPVPGLDKVLRVLASTIEHTIAPLVHTMDKKLDIDLKTHEKMSDVLAELKKLEAQIK
ncbi:MAG: hypothetical protein ACI93R_001296 [Flavobacteriales bacterium]|jgi:hypothetical protein